MTSPQDPLQGDAGSPSKPEVVDPICPERWLLVSTNEDTDWHKAVLGTMRRLDSRLAMWRLKHGLVESASVDQVAERLRALLATGAEQVHVFHNLSKQDQLRQRLARADIPLGDEERVCVRMPGTLRQVVDALALSLCQPDEAAQAQWLESRRQVWPVFGPPPSGSRPEFSQEGAAAFEEWAREFLALWGEEELDAIHGFMVHAPEGEDDDLADEPADDAVEWPVRHLDGRRLDLAANHHRGISRSEVGAFSRSGGRSRSDQPHCGWNFEGKVQDASISAEMQVMGRSTKLRVVMEWYSELPRAGVLLELSPPGCLPLVFRVMERRFQGSFVSDEHLLKLICEDGTTSRLTVCEPAPEP